ncbi:MAG TPA: hypothetical protein VNQ76_15675 [Planctomicrobium sp.]|nr:hypothetical protein [Planctomicrobium sp.]
MRYLSIVISMILLGATVFAGDLLRRTEARRYYSLPGHEYRGPQPVNPVSGVSQLAIPLTYTYTDADTRSEKSVQAKVFQLDASELRNDHCQLTKVALTIQQNGKWMLNFTARQDPDLVPTHMRASFERFERNLFCVSVYGAGLFPTIERIDVSPTGKPQLFYLFLQPTVLEKRQISRLNYSGHSDEISRYFELIDRVEIDLRYR